MTDTIAETNEYMQIQTDTGGYTRIHADIDGYKRIQAVTGGYKAIQTSTKQFRSCRVATAKTCSGEAASTITPLASSYSADRVQTENSDFQDEDHQHAGLSEPASDGVNLHHFHDFTISVQDTIATENHQDMLRRSCFQGFGLRHP